VREARVGARGGADRIESAGHGFHEVVERAFNGCAAPASQAAHPECGPIATVNASGTEQEVLERVLATLSAAIPDLFPMRDAAHA
jgi:thymidylate kinase